MAEDVAAALTSLAFATLPDEDRRRLEGEATERGIDDLDVALEELTSEPVPRLIKLEYLVRLAVNRPGFFEDARARHSGLDGFLQSLAPDIGSSEVVAEKVLESLRRLGGLVPDLTPKPAEEDGVEEPPAAHAEVLARAWSVFVADTAEVLQLNAMEVNKPELAKCDDRRVFRARTAPNASVDAREVIVRFKSPLMVKELVDYADPRKWPGCSAYFRAMTEIKPTLTPLNHPKYNGWQAAFCEEVDGLPGKVLETPLLFQHRRALDGSYIRTSYELLAATNDITYDSGFIEVAALPAGTSSGMHSLVTAAKVIAFTDSFFQRGNWVSYACDTFWIELAVNMATNCGKPVPT